ncbi:MAG: hypothetical protein ACP5NW_00415 [Candidatus Woesearchaeota archaeon]
MEFQTLKVQALEKLKVADHLVGTTYSLVREPKLLVSVVENICQALELTMQALIENEKRFVNIPKYSPDFNSIMELFRRKIATKYGIHSDVTNFIMDMKKTLDSHKKASVEFTKKETFVMSDNSYNLTTLNIDDVKKTLIQARKYVDELFKIIKV